jgi:phosphatidylglycerol:prolipoprotein diacylglycerol transferase
VYARFGDQIWITPYGLMLVIALIASWLYARRRAAGAGIDTSHIDLAVPLIFIVATLGAKDLTLIIPDNGNIVAELYQTHTRFRLFGLLLIGFPLLLLYSRSANLSFRGMLDVFAIPVVLWLVILRFGCFMAGCCWGDLAQGHAGLSDITEPELIAQVRTLPWFGGDWLISAVSFPAGSLAYQQHLLLGLIEMGDASSLPVHPTQLYELVILLGLLAYLRHYSKKIREPGIVALHTLGGYCVIRFFIEYLRADNVLALGIHTITQLTCVALLLASIAAYIIRTRRGTPL